MTFWEEAASALAAALRVLRHEKIGFDEFNATVEGFFRSFGAFLFVAPLAYPLFRSSHAYQLHIAEVQGLDLPPPSLGADYAVLGLSIVLWPIIAAVLARLLGLSATYLRYIVAYNWISVPAILVSLLPHIVTLGGSAGGSAAMLLFIAVAVVLTYLSWYVARHGLETTGAIAAVFVLADYALTYSLDWLVGA